MNKQDVVGVWKLISFEIFWKDSRKVIRPYGENPVGYLIYTLDGFVSLHFMRANRKVCSSADYRNTTVSEKTEMADNYGGYIGRFEIRDQTIIHYPEVCVFPNFHKVPQEREFSLSGKRLTLECDYPGEDQGKQGRSQIIWQRE